MNPSTDDRRESPWDTFTSYKQARKLQEQASRLEGRIELLARYGVERADKLSTRALDRYIRRMHAAHRADDLHWRVHHGHSLRSS